MADKDLDELAADLKKAAVSTAALSAAQLAAKKVADQLGGTIGALDKQLTRAAKDVESLAGRLNDVAHSAASAASQQAAAASVFGATGRAAQEYKERLEKTREAAKDLGSSMVDMVAAIASGGDPMKVLASGGGEVAKALLKAKVDGVNLIEALKALGLSTGLLQVASTGAAAAQGAQAAASAASAATAEAASIAGGGQAVANAAVAETAAAAAAGEVAFGAATAATTVAKEAGAVAATELAAAESLALAPLGLLIAAVGLLGGGLYLLNKRHEEFKGTLDDVSKRVEEQRKSLADVAPSLGEMSDKNDLAAVGMANLTKHLADGRSKVDGYAEAVKRYTIERLKANVADATSNLNEARKTLKEARDPSKVFRLGPIGAKAQEQAALEQKEAITAVTTAVSNLTQARSLLAEGERTDANILAGLTGRVEKHTGALKERAEALKVNTLEQIGLLGSQAEYRATLAEEIETIGLSIEALHRRKTEMMASRASTPEEAEAIRAMGKEWEYRTGVMREGAEVQKAANAQQSETIKTLRDAYPEGVRLSSTWEKLAIDAENWAKQSSGVQSAVEGIGEAINRGDWTTALSGLANVMAQLDTAFTSGKGAAEKFAAAMGAVRGVGTLIGGTGGAAISGAASGALGGMSLVASLAAAGTVIPGIGNVAGAAIGAVIGGLGSLLGSSKAKKQAKAQAAAEAAQRQAQIAAQGLDLDIQIAEANGDTATAKRLRRQQTLAGVAPANQVRQQQLFDIEDAKQREADIKGLNDALSSLGMAFQSIGDATDAARDQLIKLSGGLDALGAQASFFAEHFLTEEERLKPVKDSVASKLAELKLPADLSREGFKTLVLSQNVSTEDGAKMYAALMALAPAFDKVASAAESAKAAVEGKAKSLQDQIDDFVLSPAQKLAKSRALEIEAVKKLDASLVPLLETLWKTQDAAEAAKLATDRSNMYADLLEAQGRTEEAKALKRSLALAAIDDPVQKQYQQQIWAAEDAAAKVAEARNVLTEAYNRERDAIQATKDKFAELSKSLRGFSASLSATIAGSDLAGRYRSTRQVFLATAAMARLGDPDAMGRLQAEGEAFTAASRDYVATSQDYLRDVGLVRSAVDEAADTADRQASIAEEQLKALNASVQGLIQINTSVISVRDAIAGLQGALAQQAAVLAAPAPVPSTPKPETNSSWANPGKTLDGKYYYDAFLGNLAATTASHDPQYYPDKVNPALTPGTYEYSLLETFKARDPLGYYNMKNSLGFATGGSFEVGGSGPPDSKFFGLALSPGEAVNVRRRGDSGDQVLVNELRRLREELADLRATSARIATSNDKMERTLTNVTEGGRAMQTQAAA